MTVKFYKENKLITPIVSCTNAIYPKLAKNYSNLYQHFNQENKALSITNQCKITIT